MSEEDQMEVNVDQLPPMIRKVVHALEADRKKLMKNKAFNDGEQLRNFIGLHLYPRLTDFVKVISAGLYDTYELATSNMHTQRRFAAMVTSELHSLGSDIDHDTALPGIRADTFDDLQQAMYALAAMLEKKLPDDKEMQDTFNACTEIMRDMHAELTGEPVEDESDEDEPEGESKAADEPQEPPPPASEESESE